MWFLLTHFLLFRVTNENLNGDFLIAIYFIFICWHFAIRKNFPFSLNLLFHFYILNLFFKSSINMDSCIPLLFLSVHWLKLTTVVILLVLKLSQIYPEVIPFKATLYVLNIFLSTSILSDTRICSVSVDVFPYANEL